MALAIVSSAVLALQGSVTRSKVTIVDTTVDPPVNVDPYKLTVAMTDLGGSPIVQDVWPNTALRIVRTGVGQFYVDFGAADGEVNGAHLAGVSTLSIKLANPASSSAWPSSGNLSVDFGANRETLSYSAVSIVAGTGTFTLTAATTKAHADGAPITGPNTETSNLGDYLVNWKTELTAGGVITDSLEKFKVVSLKAASIIPEFKLMIDKTRKFVDSANECFLGYTDSQLMSYIEGGLNNINAYQPSLVLTLENFPLEYRQVLIDASLITGVMSQQLYAVDTDIPNYNDQGTSFVITHQMQLASFLNQVTARLDRLIPMMKLQLIQPGSLHVQMGPSFRLQTLMSAAPSGSIFRGVFFKG